MRLGALCRLRDEPGIETLTQIPVQFCQSTFFEMQELDLGQEFFLLHDCGDTVADDLDDFLRCVGQRGRDHQLHGDRLLLADGVVAQYAYAVRRYPMSDALVDADCLVLFSAAAQETHHPVRREKRMLSFIFHLHLRSMVDVVAG